MRAVIDLKIPPRRMLTLREAADYCGRPAAKFKTECAVAPVVYPDDTKLYDMRDLDDWIDGLKGASMAQTAEDILAKLG